uniref:Uncharacterized protein n=1 Tax=Anguilla anguilla TaxID=7936 RepID=A0A0E9R1S0_ANGAN
MISHCVPVGGALKLQVDASAK